MTSKVSTKKVSTKFEFAGTVSDFCQKYLLSAKKQRLEYLENMGGAPEMIMTNLRAKVNEPVKVNKVTDFANVIVTSYEVKKGKGGKTFLRLETTTEQAVNFFPNAQYGPFVAWES